jgi:hypothetical protein
VDQDQKAVEAERAAVVEKYKPVSGDPLVTRTVNLNEKGTWFRVLAGPVKSHDEAASLCRKLGLQIIGRFYAKLKNIKGMIAAIFAGALALSATAASAEVA